MRRLGIISATAATGSINAERSQARVKPFISLADIRRPIAPPPCLRDPRSAVSTPMVGQKSAALPNCQHRVSSRAARLGGNVPMSRPKRPAWPRGARSSRQTAARMSSGLGIGRLPGRAWSGVRARGRARRWVRLRHALRGRAARVGIDRLRGPFFFDRPLLDDRVEPLVDLRRGSEHPVLELPEERHGRAAFHHFLTCFT